METGFRSVPGADGVIVPENKRQPPALIRAGGYALQLDPVRRHGAADLFIEIVAKAGK